MLPEQAVRSSQRKMYHFPEPVHGPQVIFIIGERDGTAMHEFFSGNAVMTYHGVIPIIVASHDRCTEFFHRDEFPVASRSNHDTIGIIWRDLDEYIVFPNEHSIRSTHQQIVVEWKYRPGFCSEIGYLLESERTIGQLCFLRNAFGSGKQ